jgi:hypothetical protein
MGTHFTALFAAALVLFIIYRQLQRRPVEGPRLVVMPLVLAVLGLYGLTQLPPATGAAVTALVASVASAVAFGLARGLSMRVWQDAGGALQQGAPLTVVLWAISFVVRVGIGAMAQRAGVAPSVTLGELPLFFGVTLGAQNLVIWRRAQSSDRAGIPPADRRLQGTGGVL